MLRITVAALCLALLGGLARGEVPPGEQLLPQHTQGMVSVADLEELENRWDQTQFGMLMADPIMKEFVEDFRGQVRARRARDQRDLGLTWEDLKSIAGGRVTRALLQEKPASDSEQAKRPVRVMLVDVSGKEKPTTDLLIKVKNNLEGQGAQVSFEGTGDFKTTVFRQDGGVRLAYFLAYPLLCAADDVATAQAIYRRYAAQDGSDSLAKFRPFVEVKKRLLADRRYEAATPQAEWFAQPLGFAAARQALNPDYEPKRSDMLNVLGDTGFEAAQGAGGLVSLDLKSFDVLHRVAVYAPKPWQQSMNMLSLVNGPQLGVEDDPWVPMELATHTTASVEVLKAFDHFGPMFDARVGGGRKDVWKDTLDGMQNDPFGPQVDVRGEIVVRLASKLGGLDVGRGTVLTDNRLPISPESERRLTAVRINGLGAQNKADEAAVREALHKILEPDEAATLHRDLIEGYDIWEVREEPPANQNQKPPALRVVGPNGVRNVPPPRPRRTEPQALCVAHGQIFTASHMSLMLKILRQASERRNLARDPDYQLVMEKLNEEIARRGWKAVCVRRFSRTDEAFRTTYELARQGKLQESQGLLARLLRNGVAPGDDEEYDYSKLPPYQAARRFLQPGGTVVLAEDDGWFLISVVLKKGG